MSILTPGVIQDLWGLKLMQYGGPSVRKGTQNSEYRIRFKKANTYLKKKSYLRKAEKYHRIIETKKLTHFHQLTVWHDSIIYSISIIL